MKQTIRIVPLTGTFREIDRLLLHGGNRFSDLCGEIIIFQEEYKAEQLYVLCSWIMQLELTPGNKQLTKEFILDYFFYFGETLEFFSQGLNIIYSNRIHSSNYERDNKKEDPFWFKNYRKFVEKVAELLAQRQLELHTFKRLVKFYLIKKHSGRKKRKWDELTHRIG